MPYSLPVKCIGWSQTVTIRVSRLTANLPVRIVRSLELWTIATGAVWPLISTAPTSS
jgi:hypothetical protein